MPIYKPSELRSFLDELGIAPKKSLSQNFLIDGNILRKIVATAAPGKDDLILEIGPGPGSLTELLLETGANVVACEKDQILANALKRLMGSDNKLHVVCEDIREFDFEKQLLPHLIPGRKALVVANLPYHLTTPILARLLPLFPYFSSLTVMVQEEMARRMTAQPGSQDYSSFSIFLNFYSQPAYAFKVKPGSFFPIPKVDSAVVKLTLKPAPEVSNVGTFFEFVRKAFKQRRKMLKSTFKDEYDPEMMMQLLEKMEKGSFARPEELSLENFLTLFKELASTSSSDTETNQ